MLLCWESFSLAQSGDESCPGRQRGWEDSVLVPSSPLGFPALLSPSLETRDPESKVHFRKTFLFPLLSSHTQAIGGVGTCFESHWEHLQTNSCPYRAACRKTAFPLVSHVNGAAPHPAPLGHREPQVPPLPSAPLASLPSVPLSHPCSRWLP